MKSSRPSPTHIKKATQHATKPHPLTPTAPADKAAHVNTMVLLDQLVEHSVDDDYAAAAAARQARGEPPVRVSAPLVAGVLAVGLLLALAVNQVQATADTVSAERSQLADQVKQRGQTVEELEAEVIAIRADIAELEQANLPGLAAESEALKVRLGVPLGTVEVTGPGVSVKLTDAESLSTDGLGGGRVLDIDVQRVVNGLWSAGAEAVSIGPERITNLSAIRSANDVILINYRPIAPPYTIEAIGNQDALVEELTSGSAGAWLEAIAASDDIAYSVREEDELNLPAESGLSLRYARAVESGDS